MYFDLYLISEKSVQKNQVRQNGFLVYFELDLSSLQKSISELILQAKIQFVELDFYNLIFQKSSTDQLGARNIEKDCMISFW